MGKSTGFLEYKREVPKDREPLERIKDWQEFHLELPEATQQIQGARCMDCGVPYCHSGMMIAGGASGCPIHNLIPEWNDMIYKGLWKEALARLLKTNNFPEFTGRVCPAPCEGACTVGLNEPQVTIKTNECTIIDRAFKEGWITPNPPQNRTDKKIAVVGSGPAGLACAAELNKAGHRVTVYERADRVGGLLMYGIPNMKLDKTKVVQRRIDLMKAEGINFVTSTEVGKDYPVNDLKKDYDAVVLCGGATKPRDLPVEGRNLKGVDFAINFLSANTKSLLDSNLTDGNYTSAKDKHVVIIGGGDTGTDCVATSIRHGCNSVLQLEIMPKPPETRAQNNPWPEWPKTYKLDYGQEEAVALYGSDPRQYCTTTKKIVGDADGHVTAVHTIEIEWVKDASGRMTMKEILGTEKVLPADLVLLAMGFLGPDDQLLEQLGLERDARSNVKADYGVYQTNIDNIFAAGDMRRGQSLVVWAINEGREAAQACHRYLTATSK
ncbi:glutamate synthase subunit beta [Acetobacterium woodii]|uniref:Glutamate synthase NADH/NADPH small subunit GltB n=1 Tax=Acetobacterium woodii (strain ATCC 29683 / DSM 1030 / JCM 2381 / KCTC 1655 / WB1) TaxID=931626 RepID=H6LKE1_ACEWD|nr:glutamate synthase subunit beta [Acetobacterium woodii]AFA47531.1 glutamate synthase NADH/NADPH small subunit GltB [Acetobacterium woodii DSM 1030]